MWQRKACLLAFLVVILTVSCGQRPQYQPIPQSGVIGIRTDKTRYDSGEDVRLIITNGSVQDIIIPIPENLAYERSLRYYQETVTGWIPLLLARGCWPEPIAHTPGLLVPAGQEVDVDITRSFVCYTTDPISPSRAGQIVVQVYYARTDSDTDSGWVQYSAPFVTPPQNRPAETNVVTASLGAEPARALTIENGSPVLLWFPYDSVYGHLHESEGPITNRYISLQHRTDEGSWQVLRLPPERWRDSLEPIEIAAGQAVTIELHPWFQEKMVELGPGVYRWDIVLYLEYDPADKDQPLWPARHIFSKPFHYNP